MGIISGISVVIFDGWIHFVILFCTAIGLYIVYLKRSYVGFPPGPWGLPLSGYLFLFSKEPFKDFVEITKRYGDVFSITIGSRRDIIVLNHYDVIKEALVKDGEIYTGKPIEGLAAEFGDNINVIVKEGDHWKQQRNFLLSTLKHFGVGKNQMEENILEEAEKTIEQLLDSKGPIDKDKTISFAIANVICRVIYGRRFTPDDKDILEKFEFFNNIVETVTPVSLFDAFPFLQHLVKLMPMFSTFQYAKRKLYEFTDQEVARHKKTFDKNCIHDIIDVYLMKQQQIQLSETPLSKQNVFTEEYLRANLMSLFLAAVESTSGTLSWILKLLALNPQTQRKIQQEIDEVIGQERLPSMNDRPKMPFTESTLLEVQRYISYLPLMLYRRTLKETSLNGYRIPKHNTILINLWSVHYDPRIWKNPAEFIPERFVDEDGNISNLRDYVIPFSIGKRSCLGESLARMEIFPLHC